MLTICSLLLLQAASHAGAGCTPLVRLAGDDACTRCSGWLLPGKAEDRVDLPLRVDSDLPELFRGEGVLYATTTMLAPFAAKDGKTVSAALRAQRNNGWLGMDASCEVFLYHFLRDNPDARKPVRIVVLAKNRAPSVLRLRPALAVATEGGFAAPDGPEAALGAASLSGSRTRQVEPAELQPNESAVVAWTPRLGMDEVAPDATTSTFVNAMLQLDARAQDGTRPLYDLHVVAVAASVPLDELNAACNRLLGEGARSEETMDLSIPPPDCHVRRVAGVSRNFVWRGGATIDASALPADGLAFLMGAPAVQTKGCPEARQTRGMLLHPGYVHPETIGNYMVEHEIELVLANPAATPAAIDVRFGKDDADIGLAWQTVVGDAAARPDALRARQVRTGWAGKNCKDDLADDTRSLLAEGGLAPAKAGTLVLAPGERRTVSLRLLPLPSSSMPWKLKVVRGGG